MADPPGGTDVFAAFCEAGLWPGLGRATADRLATAGVTTSEHVTTSRLAEVKGISAARAERLAEAFRSAAPCYAVTELLARAGIPVRVAGRVTAELGPRAAAVLRTNPWRLLDCGEADLPQADRLAAALQVDLNDQLRGAAVLGHLLIRAARAGDTAAPVEPLLRASGRDGVQDPPGALAAAVAEGRLVLADGLVTLRRYAMAEEGLADGLARLTATAEPLKVRGKPPQDLDEAQREAVTAALEHGVALLTGGPGTGKSRTVASVVDLATRAKAAVALAAPTGRAAKRLEELAGAPACTLHRLLQAQGAGGSRPATFARDAHNPLEADLIVIDEASMLDVELAAALLDACADGTHLLLVGDPAQLPSIGPGRVLGDLVDAALAPVTELRTLYRQAEGGAIARLATAVRIGQLPPPAAAPDHEVVVVPARDAREAAHRTVQLVTDSIPRALGILHAEVQVVTPVHRGAAGTEALNAALKAALNPGPGASAGFDVGDRVVATANHLDEGFANGEVGVVIGTGNRGRLTVAFPAGTVEVPPGAIADLRHGWAITVHRAQGSEWPAVVAVLPPEAAGMLSRPLVYTALTRARRHLSVVSAAGPALRRAVREIGGRRRVTMLPGLLGAGSKEGAG